MIQQWEYLEVKLPGDDKNNTEALNELGSKGWELVSVRVMWLWYTGKNSMYTFKRAKQ